MMFCSLLASIFDPRLRPTMFCNRLEMAIISVIEKRNRCLGLGRNDSVAYGSVGGGFMNLVLN